MNIYFALLLLAPLKGIALYKVIIIIMYCWDCNIYSCNIYNNNSTKRKKRE